MTIAVSFSYITPTVKGEPMSSRDQDQNRGMNKPGHKSQQSQPKPAQHGEQVKQDSSGSSSRRSGNDADLGKSGH